MSTITDYYDLRQAKLRRKRAHERSAYKHKLAARALNLFRLRDPNVPDKDDTWLAFVVARIAAQAAGKEHFYWNAVVELLKGETNELYETRRHGLLLLHGRREYLVKHLNQVLKPDPWNESEAWHWGSKVMRDLYVRAYVGGSIGRLPQESIDSAISAQRKAEAEAWRKEQAAEKAKADAYPVNLAAAKRVWASLVSFFSG